MKDEIQMNKYHNKSPDKLWIKIKEYVRKKSFGILFLTGCLMCLGLEIFAPWQIVQAMPPSLSGKIDRQSSATARYSSRQYREAIKLWTDALTQTSDNKTRATLHTNLGSAYRQIGSIGEAIASWEKAAKIYRSQNDKESNRLLAQVLTEQGQAYNALGQSRIALPILKTAIELTQKNQDASTEAAARGALGNAYFALGDFEEAIASQKASLELATKLNNPKLITVAANNLGNVFKSRYQRYILQSNSAKREGDEKEETRLLNLAKENKLAAIQYYENSLQSSQAVGEMLQVKALLNLARLLDMGESSQQKISQKYRQQAMLILDKEPDSRAKIYALINLAQNLEDTAKIENLSQAIASARNIADLRAESFALTALGEIYFSAGDFVKAMQLAQSSAFAAQQVNAADSLYHAQALAGRINKAIGFFKEAVSSCRQAIATLQTIRGDLAVASKDLQFDLRDSTEPVYRELMALLLEDQRDKGDNSLPPLSTPNSPIQEALQVSELLQLSELQNFFGDECVQVARQPSKNSAEVANNTNNNAAVINSIILNERTYMLLRLPNGKLNSYPVAISEKELEKQIDHLRLTLEDISTDEYLTESQKVYDLTIRPMAEDLAQAKPNTLVFINDGVLRNVPMAALHDGKQFLVEKYAIATTLGFDLNSHKQHIKRDAKAVIFGLTAEIPPFAPLPNVKSETEGVQKIIGGKRFLDKDFTVENLQKQIENFGYSIIHLATHGKFGADPNSTFLQLFDRRVSLNEFESILLHSKKPIELLTLSACQTAVGDSRATLGIAGVALRVGVQSTLATLWFVNDADTVPLIQDFYTQMQEPGFTKAEALRQAQLKIIADPNGHPAIWSPFVLVGNWQ